VGVESSHASSDSIAREIGAERSPPSPLDWIVSETVDRPSEKWTWPWISLCRARSKGARGTVKGLGQFPCSRCHGLVARALARDLDVDIDSDGKRNRPCGLRVSPRLPWPDSSHYQIRMFAGAILVSLRSRGDTTNCARASSPITDPQGRPHQLSTKQLSPSKLAKHFRGDIRCQAGLRIVARKQFLDCVVRAAATNGCEEPSRQCYWALHLDMAKALSALRLCVGFLFF
jgi:hypothetical protein